MSILREINACIVIAISKFYWFEMEEGHNDQHYEKVLARFANPIDSDEEDDDLETAEDRWYEDERNDIITSLSISKELRYEFKVAFDLVSGDSRYVTRAQIFDLMLALGYTFQESDVDE